jgi:hypothetical protein
MTWRQKKMRAKDMEKNANEKAAKTVSFDKPVLEQMESLAKIQNTTVSNLVNWACRRTVMNEIKYYNEMALYHEQQRAKFEFLRNRETEKLTISREVRE